MFWSPEKRVFELEYRVRATADQQEMLKLPLGVELEIMVYEKGKDLLRWEQNRGGKMAMTWTLEQFTPGRVTEI